MALLRTKQNTLRSWVLEANNFAHNHERKFYQRYKNKVWSLDDTHLRLYKCKHFWTNVPEMIPHTSNSTMQEALVTMLHKQHNSSVNVAKRKCFTQTCAAHVNTHQYKPALQSRLPFNNFRAELSPGSQAKSGKSANLLRMWPTTNRNIHSQMPSTRTSKFCLVAVKLSHVQSELFVSKTTSSHFQKRKARKRTQTKHSLLLMGQPLIDHFFDRSYSSMTLYIFFVQWNVTTMN